MDGGGEAAQPIVDPISWSCELKFQKLDDATSRRFQIATRAGGMTRRGSAVKGVEVVSWEERLYIQEGRCLKWNKQVLRLYLKWECSCNGPEAHLSLYFPYFGF